MRYLTRVPDQPVTLTFLVTSVLVAEFSPGITTLIPQDNFISIEVEPEEILSESEGKLKQAVDDLCQAYGTIFRSCRSVAKTEWEPMQTRRERKWSPRLVVPAAENQED